MMRRSSPGLGREARHGVGGQAAAARHEGRPEARGQVWASMRVTRSRAAVPGAHARLGCAAWVCVSVYEAGYTCVCRRCPGWDWPAPGMLPYTQAHPFSHPCPQFPCLF